MTEEEEQQEDENKCIRPRERARGQKEIFTMSSHVSFRQYISKALIE